MNIISGYGLFGHQLVGVKIYISLDMKELLKVLATPPPAPRANSILVPWTAVFVFGLNGNPDCWSG